MTIVPDNVLVSKIISPKEYTAQIDNVIRVLASYKLFDNTSMFLFLLIFCLEELYFLWVAPNTFENYPSSFRFALFANLFSIITSIHALVCSSFSITKLLLGVLIWGFNFCTFGFCLAYAVNSQENNLILMFGLHVLGIFSFIFDETRKLLSKKIKWKKEYESSNNRKLHE